MSSATSDVTYTSIYTDSEPGRAFGEPIMRRYRRRLPRGWGGGSGGRSDSRGGSGGISDEVMDRGWDTPDDSIPYEGEIMEDDVVGVFYLLGMSPGMRMGRGYEEGRGGGGALSFRPALHVIPAGEPVIPPEGDRAWWCLARCTAPPTHSPPLPPSSGCLTQIQTLRIASTQALLCSLLSLLSTTSLPPLPHLLSIAVHLSRDTLWVVSIVDAEERRQGIRDVGYGIRDTWVDPAEAVPEIAPMTVDEDDSMDGGGREADASDEAWARSIGLSQATHKELSTHRDHVPRLALHMQQSGVSSISRTERRRQESDGRRRASTARTEARDFRSPGGLWGRDYHI
ncbi:hypothetical protein Tco_1328374 [Tanacetum coccineum]